MPTRAEATTAAVALGRRPPALFITITGIIIILIIFSLYISVYIYIYIHIYMYTYMFSYLYIGKRSAEPWKGARPSPKAKTYLGDVWTSQPEQVLMFSLMTSIMEKLAQKQTYLWEHLGTPAPT